MKKRKIAFDIEASSLLNDATVDYAASPWVLRDNFKVHCIVAIDMDTNETFTFVQEDCYSKFPKWVRDNVSEVVHFNGINYDMLACKAAFGMHYTVGPDTWAGEDVYIHDLYVLSKTLSPDRRGHSLEYFGELLGFQKIDWRAKAVELGLIAHDAPKGAEFAEYHPEMLVYCIRDVQVTIKTYHYLMKEWGEWDWAEAYELEKAVAEIITRQSHRGFWFDSDLAIANARELDKLLQERREAVEPHLPLKPMGKTKLKEYTPGKEQFKKNGEPNSNIHKWCEKHGGVVEQKEGGYYTNLYGVEYKLPIAQEPIVTLEPSNIEDSTFIKGVLVEMGWKPTAYKERDLTLDTRKQKLSQQKFVETVERYVEQTLSCPFKLDRCERVNTTPANLKNKLLGHDIKKPLKVYTNPTFTVGQEKEIDPELEKLYDKFPYVQQIVEYLTYKHRRSSILGGGVDIDDWEDTEDDLTSKGFLANVRRDGRIPTPADTCGAATGRMLHRLVANVPRVTTLFGEPMRRQFGVGDTKRYVQFAYDFSSLEGREEAHYCVPLDAKALTRTGWKAYGEVQIGDEVLGYNEVTGQKEWTVVEDIVFYEKSLTYNLEWKSHKYRATGDHRWFVKQRDTTTKSYKNVVKTTLELNTASSVIVNAPFNLAQDTSTRSCDITQGKWGQDWVGKVLSMSQAERVSFLEGFMIADGYWHEHKQQPIWRWAQNNNELFEAALTASFLVHDGNVTVANNAETSKVKVVSLCRNNCITGQKLKVSPHGVEPTWCVRTKLGSWVMRQGDCITITGNCWRYDEDKAYCNSLIQEKPNDVHTKTASKVAEMIGQAFGRTPAKAVKYASTYGAQAPRIAKTVGCALELGAKIFDAFWEAALPLKFLKEALTNYWKTVGKKKFILGIDGRKINTRSEHALLNSLFQSAGVICAKRTMVYQEKLMREQGLIVDFWSEDWKNKSYAQQLIAYHDEAQFEVTKDLIKWKVFPVSGAWEVWSEDKQKLVDSPEAKEAKKECENFVLENPEWVGPGRSERGYFAALSPMNNIVRDAVEMTNRHYKMKVPLAVDPQYGRNWAECH